MNIYKIDDLDKITLTYFEYNYNAKKIYNYIDNIITDLCGPSLKKIDFLGITFTNKKRNPSITYLGKLDSQKEPKEFVIDLPITAKDDLIYFVYYISHEKVHALSPSYLNKPKCFEEGMAHLMSQYVLECFFKDYPDIEPIKLESNASYGKYDECKAKMIDLFVKNQNWYIIKEIREIEPDLRKINKEHFIKYTKESNLLNFLISDF